MRSGIPTMPAESEEPHDALTTSLHAPTARQAEESDLRDRLVALTRDLMVIPSHEGRPDAIERCGEFLANHLDLLPGVQVRRFEHEGTLSLTALPEGIPAPELLLVGHFDVIAHEDPGVYGSRIEGGRIVGPGSGDMKGQLAIMLEVMHHFHRRHPGIPLGMAATSDEERGGMAGVRHLVEDLGLRCGAAMIPDGGGLGEVTLEEKGILHLRARAGGRSAHAARPWLGDNAVDRLLDALAAVRARFRAYEALGPGDEWRPTCSTTILRTANRTTNRVPDAAEAVLDIRFPPPHTVEGMLAEVREALGPEIEAHALVAAEPSNLRPDPGYIRAVESVLGTPPRLIRECGGSDARFFAAAGIPVMISRPAVGGLHSVDEWIDIDSMVSFHRIWTRYIEDRLLGGGGQADGG